MFLLNSCLGQFSAACLSRHSFSRSYGVILPSSLTMLLPSALGFSPHPPVSVYGTGLSHTIAAFLGSAHHFPTLIRSASRLRIDERICLFISYLACTRFFHFRLVLFHTCPHSSVYLRYRNFNLLSIGYVFRPRLRSRLTLGGSALPQETLDIRRRGFSPLSRYSFRHSLFHKVHRGSRLRLRPA